MNYKLKYAGILLLVITGLYGFTGMKAQELRDVSGVVSDALTGGPLPGANVLIKGSQRGAITDPSGKYQVQADAGTVLVFSFIGYETVEAAVGDRVRIDVSLKPMAEDLGEIVVIGYGTSYKKDVTGSISSLKSDDFNKGVFNDALGLIQGKVAGLTIRKPGGGDPQAGYEIILRGTNTLTSGQGPLIIIDGVAGADIKNIDFAEVESVDVLKDGSAAAIYGTRGTNGVIIITTRRAKAGSTGMEFSSQLSAQLAPRWVKTLSADEFRDAIETYAPDKAGSIYGARTDWFKEVTNPLPLSHKHNLAFHGGTENFYHRTALNIDDNTGLLKNNESTRYLFKTNIIQKALNGKLELDFNLTAGQRNYRPANYNVFYQAFIQNPTQPVYDPANTMFGGYSSLPGIEYYNPVAMLNEQDRRGKTTDLSPNLRVSLKILENLKFTNFVSYEGSSWETAYYRTKYYPTRIGSDGVAEIAGGSNQNLQYESTLNYSRTIGNHNIQAVGGYTFQEQSYFDDYMVNSDFDSDISGPWNIGSGQALFEGTAEMGSYRESSRLISFLGRVIYNYDQRYLLSLSLRREGSSRFGENNKWGSFPALSFGWRINEEDFMQDNTLFSDLKFRIGYGVTGNQDFANYKSLILMGRSGKFFYNGEWINSYQPVSNPNPDLRWERKMEFNTGFDFSLKGDRVSGALDYYYRTSTDLLYTYDVPVPPYLYRELFTNVGTIRNTGVELSLNFIPVKTGRFTWNSLFTASSNMNKLVKFSNDEFTNKYIDIGWIGGAIPQNSQRIEEGKSLGNFFGAVWLGLDESGYDRFKNANPIGKVDPDKWEVMGNAYPIASLGWGNTFSYGKLELSLNLRSQLGGDVLNMYRLYYENWQNIGTRNIVYSQYENPEFIGNATYSSKYVENATFLKVDNLSLSYRNPVRIPYIANWSVNLNAQDLLLITAYKGIDPEVRLSGLTPGIDPLSYYPRTTTLTLGVKLTLE